MHFPIGADLVLHQMPDHAAILHYGTRLGQVVTEAGYRFKTRLAFPVMDLMLEKTLLLRALVSPDTVLYGNLPSRNFYSGELISAAEVTRLGRDLLARMQAAGHPFILGSECDVLCVPQCERQLMEKAMAIANLTPDGQRNPLHQNL
jgi:hypothetical protein